MDATRLPEVIECDGFRVRYFSAERATEFPYLSQSEKRAVPAIVRRIYAAAGELAKQEVDCLICGVAAPVNGRVLIAIETPGGQALGSICNECVSLSAPIARTA